MQAKGRILGYHLCDWKEDTRDMLLDRGMMGDGVADLKSIRKWVEQAGYTGHCEVGNHLLIRTLVENPWRCSRFDCREI